MEITFTATHLLWPIKPSIVFKKLIYYYTLEHCTSTSIEYLVSGALYSGKGGDDADPVVELSDEVAASHLHGWLEVHDLVGYVELVSNGLQQVAVREEREERGERGGVGEEGRGKRGGGKRG